MEKLADRKLPSEDHTAKSADVKEVRFPFAGLFSVLLAVNLVMIGALVHLLMADEPFAIFFRPMPTPYPVMEDAPTEQVPAPTELPAIALVTTENPPPTPLPTATQAEPTPLPPFEGPIRYGSSVQGRDLVAYRLGNGPSARAIIGGIHGGYEWNTVHLVSETMEYYHAHIDEIPDNVTLYVIPCANPDGYARGFDLLEARVNANEVDLNRNWDYNWNITATHGTRPVSGGSGPFSEPETAALRNFIFDRNIELAIFYHSAMHRIFSGADRSNSATYQLAEMMAQVTGYPHQPEGVPGQMTTGDAIDYLSTVGITAVEVELTNHQDLDWERNIAGIRAFLTWSLPGGATDGSSPLDGEAEYDLIIYTVEADESLWTIALDYGIDYDILIEFNSDLDPDLIFPGDVITVPVPRAEND